MDKHDLLNLNQTKLNKKKLSKSAAQLLYGPVLVSRSLMPMPTQHWLYAYDSVLCLNAMAAALGREEDALHWNDTVGMDQLLSQMEKQWEIETENMYGATGDAVGWSQVNHHHHHDKHTYNTF